MKNTPSLSSENIVSSLEEHKKTPRDDSESLTTLKKILSTLIRENSSDAEISALIKNFREKSQAYIRAWGHIPNHLIDSLSRLANNQNISIVDIENILKS